MRHLESGKSPDPGWGCPISLQHEQDTPGFFFAALFGGSELKQAGLMDYQILLEKNPPGKPCAFSTPLGEFRQTET
jgi:hypothetical protein